MDRRKRIAQVLSKAKRWSLTLFVFLTLACANYATRVRAPREALDFGRYDAAIEDLKKLVDRFDNDQLLYLMDLGMAYHAAALYPEAIQIFLKADRLAEIKDYTSISGAIGSVVINDTVQFYQGETFEKLLVNTYLAIDYALSGQWDDALVESRRVNQKIDRIISQGGLAYERNGFAKFLAATLFEARHEYNDAFVDYRQMAKWNMDTPLLSRSLLRMADRLKASQEFEEYQKKFGKLDFRLEKGFGEVVLILEQGRGPVKVPSEAFPLLPRFQKRFYSSDHVLLKVNGRETESDPLFDIEGTAIRELDRKIAAIAAKKIGGIVVKGVLANEVYKKNEALGILTWLALRATDQADLRSWSTLPARLHIARLVVPAGRHSVRIDKVSVNGYRSQVFVWNGVEVKNQVMTFLNYRMMD